MTIMDVVGAINGYLWGPWTFFILLGAGIVFSVSTKFIQFRIMGHGVLVVKGAYDNPDDPGAINHFQALSAALSATIGLGNIGGVALAIALGGPGALFWMWIVGFLGMALKCVEITLAMMYRNMDNPKNPSGGAMWVIEETLGKQGGWKKGVATFLGSLFCCSLLVGTMTGGNMFQAWNVADLTNLYFGVPQVGTGIALAVIVGMVIIGGIERIGSVAGKIVPVMCVLYILAGFAVILPHAAELPAMFQLIVSSAFSPTAAGGAFLGGSMALAFDVGLKRALFSNEAGQGSAPIAHAAAKTDEPAREGVVGGLGPFIDTIMICTLTALVIISTGTWNRGPQGPLTGDVQLVAEGDKTVLVAPTKLEALPQLPSWDEWQAGSQVFLLVEAPDKESGEFKPQRIMAKIVADEKDVNSYLLKWGEAPAGARWTKNKDGQELKEVFRDFKGATLTSHAFDRAFPGLGKWLITFASWMFAISTMISWSYYGEKGVSYLFGNGALLPYKVVFLLFTVMAPVLLHTDSELGNLADFGTGMMLWTNMPILILMGYLAVKELLVYFKKLDAGEFTRYDKVN